MLGIRIEIYRRVSRNRVLWLIFLSSWAAVASTRHFDWWSGLIVGIAACSIMLEILNWWEDKTRARINAAKRLPNLTGIGPDNWPERLRQISMVLDAKDDPGYVMQDDLRALAMWVEDRPELWQTDEL